MDGRRATSTPAPAGESEHTASVPATAELRYKVQFTADQAYVDLLEEARNLLQHELPARDLVEVQRRALELLVRKLRQRKYAASERPLRDAPEPARKASPPTPARVRPSVPAPPAGHSARSQCNRLGTFPLPCAAASGSAMKRAARISTREASAVASSPGSSFITSTRMHAGVQRASRTSPCAAEPTTLWQRSRTLDARSSGRNAELPRRR
jgi:hypothetical protein